VGRGTRGLPNCVRYEKIVKTEITIGKQRKEGCNFGKMGGAISNKGVETSGTRWTGYDWKENLTVNQT